jgi:hypothetical protein
VLIHVFNVLLVKKYVKKITKLKHIPMKIILTTKICIPEKKMCFHCLSWREQVTLDDMIMSSSALDQHTYLLFFIYCSYKIVKCNIESLNR